MPIKSKVIKYIFGSKEKLYWLNKGFILYPINNYRIYIYINQRELFDLKPGSNIKVSYICNNCGKEHSAQLCHIRKLNDLNHTLCAKCRSIYRYQHNDEEKRKREETNLKKFGFKNPMQSPVIQEKMLKTIQEKYGKQYTSTTQIPEVRFKQIKSLCKHDKVNTSIPQKRLHDLIHGELNFPFGFYALDIAFPAEKIAVEYNGGGHELTVLFGNKTKEEFIAKEKRKLNYIIDNNWKLITIIAPKDKIFKLYSDSEIIRIIDIMKYNLLTTNYQWIDIYIEDDKIQYSDNNINTITHILCQK